MAHGIRDVPDRKWYHRYKTTESFVALPSWCQSHRNFNQLADTREDKDYEKAKDKLSALFEPQKNRRYEVYCFRQAAQETAETLDQFHTRLRTLSKNCEFKELDFEIEQKIIIGGIFQNQETCPSRPEI